MDIQSEMVKVAVRNGVMDAYLARPKGAGGYPGVIVASEIFGVTSYIRRMTDKVAALGYVALAPDVYHRNAPEIELSRDVPGRARGLELLHQLERDDVLQDIQASIEELRHCGCPKVGMLGFSSGGHLAYLAASRLPVQAVGVFYGGWLTGTDLPVSQPEPTLSLTSGIADQNHFVLFLVGEEDHLIPQTQRQEIQRALEQAGVRHEFVVYPGIPHGFLCDEAESFREEAANDAWQRIQAMLHRELREP